MGWTKEQQEAIDARDCNLLVAAAAGSGKTAVLIERIINRVIPQNADFDEKDFVDVDKLLVVTFTKAVAAEVRERLDKAFEAKLESCTDDLIIKRIIKQKALLSKSYVMTIDSFCLNVVKQNYVICGLDPSFSIGNEDELELMEKEVLDDILEQYYTEKDHSFVRLVETYSSKLDDEDFAKIILSAYKFIQNDAFPDTWLKMQLDRYDINQSVDFWETIWGEFAAKYMYGLVCDAYESLEALLNFCYTNGVTCYIGGIEKDVKGFRELKELLKSGQYKEAFSIPLKQRFASRVGSASNFEDKELAGVVKSYRDAIKDKLTKTYDSIFSGVSNPIDDVICVSDDMKCLCRILLDYLKALMEAKHKKRIYSFSDIGHMALNLLVNDRRIEGKGFEATDLAFKYQMQFDEIYIDEYQDTSLLQEVLLSAVSGCGCGKKNIFMVGDIKQSIYGFRQARPDIFLEKYYSYSSDISDERLICLYANFRSRKCIVDGTNSLFLKIMKMATCDMDYTEKEYLNYAATCYDTQHDEKCEFITIGKSEKDSNEDVDTISNTEIEARYVAARIIKMINSGYKVYDKDQKTMRQIRLGDIAVLMRNQSKIANVFVDVFAAYGLQSSCATEGGFFSSPEISTVLSFLKVIDNPYQDIPLMALMCSKIYCFTHDEIAYIRIFNKRCSLYDACLKIAKIESSGFGESGASAALVSKVAGFVSRIRELRHMANILPLYDLTWLVVNENDFYNRVGTFENGLERQMNIRCLLDKAATNDSGSSQGLFKFVRLMQRLEDNGNALNGGVVSGESSDTIKIMTIHKSKGLEYPVVFLVGTNSIDFYDRKKESPLMLHKDLGFNPKCYMEVDGKRIVYKSFMRTLASVIKCKEVQAEELRLLYVAITRAREKFIAVGVGKKEHSKVLFSDKVSTFDILNSTHYYDWLNLVAPYSEYWECNFVERSDAYGLIIDGESIENNMDFPDEVENSDSTCVSSDIDKYIDSKNIDVNSESDAIPVKISVSDIKRLHRVSNENELEDDIVVTESFNKRKNVVMKKLELTKKNTGKKHVFTSSEKGTLVHTCLQCMDFAKCRAIKSDSEAALFVASYLDELVQKGVLDELEANAVESKLLVDFIMSEQGRRIINADKVYCEVPFTLQMKWSEIVGDSAVQQDELVSVQGIIDCFIEESDGLSVFDYKTDYVNSQNFAEIDKSYRVQLECYCKALERITGKKVKNAEILYLRKLI